MGDAGQRKLRESLVLLMQVVFEQRWLIVVMEMIRFEVLSIRQIRKMYLRIS